MAEVVAGGANRFVRIATAALFLGFLGLVGLFDQLANVDGPGVEALCRRHDSNGVHGLTLVWGGLHPKFCTVRGAAGFGASLIGELGSGIAALIVLVWIVYRVYPVPLTPLVPREAGDGRSTLKSATLLSTVCLSFGFGVAAGLAALLLIPGEGVRLRDIWIAGQRGTIASVPPHVDFCPLD